MTSPADRAREVCKSCGHDQEYHRALLYSCEAQGVGPDRCTCLVFVDRDFNPFELEDLCDADD